jgi:hypothetical protein
VVLANYLFAPTLIGSFSTLLAPWEQAAAVAGAAGSGGKGAPYLFGAGGDPHGFWRLLFLDSPSSRMGLIGMISSRRRKPSSAAAELFAASSSTPEKGWNSRKLLS